MGTTAAAEYKIEKLQKQSGESEIEALRRIVTDFAAKGWDVIEICGDEVRKPVLIFRKCPNDVKHELRVEEVPSIKHHNEIDELRQALWDMNDQGWFPLTVLDSPWQKPVAVYKKMDTKPADSELTVIGLSKGIMEKLAKAIDNELVQQQVITRRKLQTIMNKGLQPVLIFVSNKSKAPQEYLIEYAQAGVFSNQTKSLADLISARAQEGWQVEGAFEDTFFWPCVVFNREVPME